MKEVGADGSDYQGDVSHSATVSSFGVIDLSPGVGDIYFHFSSLKYEFYAFFRYCSPKEISSIE